MLIDKSGFWGLRRIQNQSLTCANEAARSTGGIVLNKLHFFKIAGYFELLYNNPSVTASRDCSPYTVEP